MSHCKLARMKFLAVLVTLVAGTALCVAAPAALELLEGPRYPAVSPEKDSGRGHLQPWAELVGSPVKVEGIVWGMFEKGYDPYVVTANGKIHLPSALEGKEAWNGKLIRATGILATKEIRAAANKGLVSQGPAKNGFIFILKDATVEQIDQSNWPWLQVVETKK